MIYQTSRYDNVTSLLKEFHWLRVPERIEFRLGALMYKCLNGSGLAYVTDSLRPQPTRRTSWKLVGNPGCELVADACGRPHRQR